MTSEDRFHGRIRHKTSRPCDWPGCELAGEFRAPRAGAGLANPLWFCLDHVRDYNANWDAFAGLGPEAINDAARATFTWDRPTWALGNRMAGVYDPLGLAPEAMKDHVRKGRADGASTRAERAALTVLGLDVTASAAEVRRAYKLLVKRHHPDLNGGSKASMKEFRRVMAAYEALGAWLKARSVAKERRTG